MASVESIIRPFLLYGGLFFTVTRRAVTVGMTLLILHLLVVTIVPVKGESMDPTLPDKTYILVDQISPRIRALARGEIVAFRYPLDPTQKFIKRIIGLPGEIVTVSENTVVLQRPNTDQPLKLREPYLAAGTQTAGSVSHVLGPVEYFAMGDNREVSLDSRTFGGVAQNMMLGRAWMVIWPLSKIHLVSHFDPVTASE